MAWSTPKTNWNLYSKFNIEDFNRIKNNIAYLHEIAVATLGGFDIEDMGSDMDNYASYWNVDHFNSIEHNLLLIANKVSTKDYGPYQTFYANGIFIGYQELNRIEKIRQIWCAEFHSNLEDIRRRGSNGFKSNFKNKLQKRCILWKPKIQNDEQ